VIVVVNLSSHHTQIGTTSLDLPVLGLDWHERFRVTDGLSGASYDWGQFNYLELDPYREPAHVFAVTFPRSVQFPPPVA
jgi:starch synthase (maltosyl-transferring)